MLARECGMASEGLRQLVGFLGAVHDIGKATPLFQISSRIFCTSGEGDLSWKPERAGLAIHPALVGERSPRHAIAGEVILKAYLVGECGWDDARAIALSCIVGSHHGKPPVQGEISRALDKLTPLGWDASHAGSWRAVQRELIEYAADLSGLDLSDDAIRRDALLPVNVESALSGLLTMADWISSNQDRYPLLSIIPTPSESSIEYDFDVWSRRRSQNAWEGLSILPCWEPNLGSSGSFPFADRFGFPPDIEPRPVQAGAIDVASGILEPGIMIVEAPMGEGKTEAALAVAEIFADRCSRGGVCIALPTMATTDAMFSRVHEWVDRLSRKESHPESIFLGHGKSGLNEEYQGLVRGAYRAHFGSIDQDGRPMRRGRGSCEETPVAEVSDWMQGRKKGMLANFTVCTVDQVLMGALAMKHLSLRHLSLVNKVVIIDECHAYDSYMQQYLNRVLEWFGSWRVPVVLLSATLPASMRGAFVASYLKGRRALDAKSVQNSDRPDLSGLSYVERIMRRRGAAFPQSISDPDVSTARLARGYPLITFSDGDGVQAKRIGASSRAVDVRLKIMPDDDARLIRLLKGTLEHGGCAGIVCDTVKRAQGTFEELTGAFGEDEVLLLHSRFTDIDRMEREGELRRMLGPHASVEKGSRPRRLIVVGTQVIEQSLDIDFDVLVSDIAPIDLLMQRIGRLHRHVRGENERERPVGLRDARCFIRGIRSLGENAVEFDRGIEAVYERASLIETLAVLGIGDVADSVTLDLPSDIARLVQVAYGADAGARVPSGWRDRYESAIERRDRRRREKERRAQTCLLKSVGFLVGNEKTLVGLFDDLVDDASSAVRGRDDDRGPRAVRDTQETIEVLLACRRADGIHLLPWVGDERRGVVAGAGIPVAFEPDDVLSRLLSRCSVRLPLEMTPGGDIDRLLDALEEMSDPFVGAWQDSGWLAGMLLVVLDEREDGVFAADILEWRIEYTRRSGLCAVRLNDLP